MNWIRRAWLTCQLVVVAMLAASVGGDTADWDCCGGEPREIFLGIVYGCRQLETTDEGSGLVYWVRVDLKAPGIKLYVTPLDQAAVAGGGNTGCVGLPMLSTPNTSQLQLTRRCSPQSPPG